MDYSMVCRKSILSAGKNNFKVVGLKVIVAWRSTLSSFSRSLNEDKIETKDCNPSFGTSIHRGANLRNPYADYLDLNLHACSLKLFMSNMRGKRSQLTERGNEKERKSERARK